MPNLYIVTEVFVIPKPDVPHDVTSYEPISFLSVILKSLKEYSHSTFENPQNDQYHQEETRRGRSSFYSCSRCSTTAQHKVPNHKFNSFPPKRFTEILPSCIS